MLQYSPKKTYQPVAIFSGGMSSEQRDYLITSHLSKVKYIADRIAEKLPSTIDRDDLYSAGVLGLIDAVERFDATRGIAFTTFAELRVRGAILDNLRSLDWASRSTRRRVREVQNAFSEVEQKKGRAATEEEVAAHLGLSLAELRKTLQDLHALAILDLDEPEEETGITQLEKLQDKTASPFEQFETAEQRRHLAKAIENLPERERQIIALYYLEELTMKEIGAVLGVSESRVSQMRTQAVLRLRTYLSKV